MTRMFNDSRSKTFALTICESVSNGVEKERSNPQPRSEREERMVDLAMVQL